MHFFDFNSIVPTIEHFGVFGYWFVLLLAFAETFFIIGLVIPGSIIIPIIGFLAAKGVFDMGDLIIFASIGAILGNQISFYLGKRGLNIFKNNQFLTKYNYINAGEKFFEKHGGKSIFFARFLGPIRPIVPFVAGMLKMSTRKFLLWNIFSGIAFAIFYLLLGYFFGHAWRLVETWSPKIGIMLLIVVVIIILLSYIKRFVIKYGRELALFIKTVFYAISRYLNSNTVVQKVLNKYPKFFKFIRDRFRSQKFTELPLTLISFIFLLTLFIFVGLIEDVINLEAITKMDLSIANLLYFYRDPILVKIFIWITMLGTWWFIISGSLVFISILYLWRKKEYILGFLLTICGSALFEVIGKIAIHRLRPEDIAIYNEVSYSFPSAHAATAITFYGFIIYFTISHVKSLSNKINLFFAGLMLVLLIGFSRLYLSVHYFSDVWGGYLLGLLWLLVGISVVEYLFQEEKKEDSVKKMNSTLRISAAVLVFLEIIFYVAYGYYYSPPLNPETPKAIPEIHGNVLSLFSGDNALQKYNETVFGGRKRPLTFIFVAENANQITSAFIEAGWNITDTPDIKTFLKLVKAAILNENYPAAPIAPSFWEGRAQELSFEKPTERNTVRERHYVKFWDTGAKAPNGEKIYVATSGFHDKVRINLMHRIAKNLDQERNFILENLKSIKVISNYNKILFMNSQEEAQLDNRLFTSDGYLYVIWLKTPIDGN